MGVLVFSLLEKEIKDSTEGFRKTLLKGVIGRFYFFLMFIFLFLRERKNTSGEGAERERVRKRIQSRVCAVSREPDSGLETTNCEIMT